MDGDWRSVESRNDDGRRTYTGKQKRAAAFAQQTKINLRVDPELDLRAYPEPTRPPPDQSVVVERTNAGV